MQEFNHGFARILHFSLIVCHTGAIRLRNTDTDVPAVRSIQLRNVPGCRGRVRQGGNSGALYGKAGANLRV
ncbi:hypothetical protein MNKW57_22250 [Biformimicrobium ophioploci]|uniref:Uncharacterized protein n=1 Tax=Biformimicrobium ophioploci TaxID=3036711 RepID=A0ABQ6M0S6_9GAMM|nr:hypothetical protein MNKW57_22250 [Microbulbifer sp. NKW57]